MTNWEKVAGVTVESLLSRWGEDIRSPKELAKILSELGPRVTEGTAYLWIKRWERWLGLKRYFEDHANGVS